MQVPSQNLKDVIASSRTVAVQYEHEAISTAHLLTALLQSADVSTVDSIYGLVQSKEQLQLSVAEYAKNYEKYEQSEILPSADGVPPGAIPLTNNAEEVVKETLSTTADVKGLLRSITNYTDSSAYMALSDSLDITKLKAMLESE
ncbi:MAG: hypothetical protein JNJ85_15125 [Candidatus Kapabacteria bacterium]|nr:hypothetical protein [Candidatus Kapabacteria bacterium]MBX7153432.1 hypothetical protein [Bacteroidota bacterium]